MGIITIATDFGTIDGYVAAMKGVIRSIAPDVELIDVAHDLDNIMKSSIVLSRYYSYYPVETIHLVVVDPTVGSDRLALIGNDGKYFFVGPDNGLFSRIIDDNPDSKWWAIEPEKVRQGNIFSTFHGRDIFAPAAALLATGKSPGDLGEQVISPEIIEFPPPTKTDIGIDGEIIDIDKFGNLITNISRSMIGKDAVILLMEYEPMKPVNTYSDVPVGKPLAYIGSLGYLEIGVNQGRAESHFAVSVGDKVRVAN